jgi:hypothetical protein
MELSISAGRDVVHAKCARMESGAVGVVQLNLSLQTGGTGPPAQRLRIRLGLGAAGVPCEEACVEEGRLGASTSAKTQRRHDGKGMGAMQRTAEPGPYEIETASIPILLCRRPRGLHGQRAGQQLSRGLVLKAMRGQAEVADRDPERIASIEQGSVAFTVDLRGVGVRRCARTV